MKNTSFLSIFESVMALVYLGISCILLFTGLLNNVLSDKTLRIALGILLGLYGVLRVFKAIRKYKDENINTK